MMGHTDRSTESSTASHITSHLAALVIGISTSLALVGCAVNRPIAYDLHGVPMLGGGPFAESVVRVQTFHDDREMDVKARHAPTMAVAVVDRAGDDWYCVSDDRFAPTVTAGVTDMVARHLDAAKLFREVAVQSGSAAPPAQYALSGTIRRFESCRQREMGKEVLVSQMGLIGLAIAATSKVDYDAHVELSDLRLIDTSTGATIWEATVLGEVQGQEPIDAYGWTVFDHANAALKAAVDQLVQRLAAVDPKAVPSVAAEAPPAVTPAAP